MNLAVAALAYHCERNTHMDDLSLIDQHHAGILDRITELLDDPDVTEITTTQHRDDAGRWSVTYTRRLI